MHISTHYKIRKLGRAQLPGEFDLCLPAGGALAEGFHDRLTEFQRFERTFEVQKHMCLVERVPYDHPQSVSFGLMFGLK